MTNKIRIDEDLYIGDGDFTVIAGPCAIENMEQMDRIGSYLAKLQVKVLRGGVFKPRTSPKSFQGLGKEGLKILGEMKNKYGFKIISEVLDPRDIEDVDKYIDIIQIGSRNMQNFALLREVGKTDKPIMLKRGMSATIKEWILAAEHIKVGGNDKIILCERGIRTFEEYTRNTLDLMSVPIIKKETEYPIFIDPSHGTGRRDLIIPASKAAKVLEADGILIEIHPEPDEALSDGEQSLDLHDFKRLLKEVHI